MAFQFGFGGDDDDAEISSRNAAVTIEETPTDNIRPVKEHHLRELVRLNFSNSPSTRRALLQNACRSGRTSEYALLKVEAVQFNDTSFTHYQPRHEDIPLVEMCQPALISCAA